MEIINKSVTIKEIWLMLKMLLTPISKWHQTQVFIGIVKNL